MSEDVKLVGWIHDEVILEISEDMASDAKLFVVKAIEDITDRIGLRVQLTGDSRIGRNWKEIH